MWKLESALIRRRAAPIALVGDWTPSSCWYGRSPPTMRSEVSPGHFIFILKAFRLFYRLRDLILTVTFSGSCHFLPLEFVHRLHQRCRVVNITEHSGRQKEKGRTKLSQKSIFSEVSETKVRRDGNGRRDGRIGASSI